MYVSLTDDASILKDDLVEKYRNFYTSDAKNNELAAKLSLATVYLFDDLPDLAEDIIIQLQAMAPREPRVMLLDCLTTLKLNPMRKIKLTTIEDLLSKLNIVLQNGSDEELSSAIQIARYIDECYYVRNGILRNKLLQRILTQYAGFDGHNDSLINQILSN